MPRLAPGKAFSFLVFILDQNGGIYKTDSSSKAILKDASQSNNDSVSQKAQIQNGESVAN